MTRGGPAALNDWAYHLIALMGTAITILVLGACVLLAVAGLIRLVIDFFR